MLKHYTIPFSPPYIDESVRNEVLDALSSGWITSGPKVLELQKLVARHVGIDQVLCCNSATSALFLALHWFGVKKGDEVIIPSYTYAATALVVLHVGATPIMVDVKEDFNIDTDNLKSKITERTKVIMPVDIAGWPCDYDKIKQIVTDPFIQKRFIASGEHQSRLGRIMILADAAHSIGAVIRGKSAARFADFSVFSFHAVKNVTTAEGGAICINVPDGDFGHSEVYKQLKLWSLNGQTKDAFTKSKAGGWKYDIVYPGFKMNLPDICAAIGLAQMRKYFDFILPERKRVFDSYVKAFSLTSWAQLPPLDNEEKKSSYHLFALRIKDITEAERDKMIDLISLAGVSVNVHFQPLPLLTIFREAGHDIQDHPVAYDNFSREISLPIYPELDQNKIDYIVHVLTQAYNSVKLQAN